ncbi:MAG: hypothetical protein M0Z66_07865 [Thermaerobacter sp.]|nr:hypothetical protein [Thermaerobacter sp.]
MDVEIVYFDGCPNWQLARQRVLEALTAVGRSDTAVRLHLVENPTEAQEAGMHGSPTILVDGKDPFPKAADDVWSCRLYQSDSGFEGAPSVSALVGVLRQVKA